MSEQILTGGCLCGALRYEARGAPSFAGHCYCEDCRKASGSGFVPFMGYLASAVTITGEALTHRHDLGGGRKAERNSCAVCGSLVFGGVRGVASSHTIYAGTLDDPAQFEPRMAIFTRGKPGWALIPPGLTVYERGPQ